MRIHLWVLPNLKTRAPRAPMYIRPIYMAAKAGLMMLIVTSMASQAYAVGAKTPFTTVEAEAGQLAGGAAVHAFVPGMKVPTVATLELEASGGAFVRLDRTGESVSWRNPVGGANAINVRNSLPDSPNGGGITATLDLYVNGQFRQAITLSSKQSWVYRTHGHGWINNPHAGGMPFKFYNEDRARIVGRPVAVGSVMMLRKDDDNSASRYDLDCMDLESVPSPRARPAGSLSVIDYGAKPNTDFDSQQAIRRCVDDARKRHMSVWIPSGRYIISTKEPKGLDFTGVAVHGAGMWYTTLYRKVPAWANQYWRSAEHVGSHTTLTDLSIDSNSVRRAIGKSEGGDYGILAGSDGWLVQRVWIQHCDAQWLSGSNGMIRDCRVADSWGDGINLNNGNHPSATTAGMHLTAKNNFVRGTGDDGLATYSDAGTAGNNSQMVGSTFINNTSIAPYWANSLRVAGGKEVVVRGNLLRDPSSNNCMDVSTYGKTGQPLESALIENNVMLRGGGWNGTDRYGLAIGSPPNAYSVEIIRNNIIKDSRRAGVYIGKAKIRLTLQHNQIIHPTTTGILIGSHVVGTGNFFDNSITGLNPGQTAIKNESTGTFVP